jgi:hypothetical protein
MGLTSADLVLYVYPQGARFADAWAAWNADPGGADFRFVDAMLADLKSKHCVDPARVRRRHVKWRLLRQLTAVLSARGIQGSGIGGRRRATVSLR